jgi:YebC/PmpR family DNA-binding regulatory protein
MPKENIQRAIKNASEKNTENYKEIVLEGYGPHGVAVIIDCTTDNNNRTVANIRSYFNKFDGNLGTNGSVEYLFDKMCVFKTTIVDKIEDLELDLIDYGLEEIVVENDESELIIYANFDSFGDIQNELEKKEIKIISSDVERIPKTILTINDEQRKEFETFIQKCEEDDDIQKIHHNV